MDGTNFKSAARLSEASRLRGGWKVAAVIDVNDDGEADIVWQHGGGKVTVWFMNGLDRVGSQSFRYNQRTSASWKVISTTDLDGDGRGDLIWQHPSGSLAVTLMDQSGKFSAPLRKGRPVKAGWSIEGGE